MLCTTDDENSIFPFFFPLIRPFPFSPLSPSLLFYSTFLRPFPPIISVKQQRKKIVQIGGLKSIHEK